LFTPSLNMTFLSTGFKFPRKEKKNISSHIGSLVSCCQLMTYFIVQWKIYDNSIVKNVGDYTWIVYNHSNYQIRWKVWCCSRL
jgi:hypothetical protein